MTSKIALSWRRGASAVLVGAGLAVGSVVGPTAVANADVIGQLACEFGTAPGSGTVSRLLNQSILLSVQGFRPSAANLASISAAQGQRPNQTPMIEALQETVEGQANSRNLAAAAAAGTGPQSTLTINQGPAGIRDPYAINSLGENAWASNSVVLGGGVNVGGQNYTIGNGGENVVPVGC